MSIPVHTLSRLITALPMTDLRKLQAVLPPTVVATAELPTRFGDFRIMAFSTFSDGKEHIALVRGDVRGKSAVPVRLHSECLTGDTLGSYRCDCRDQLEAALRDLGNREYGVLLYLRQEGRGIGLVNKIKAYALQDRGMDTVEANHALGFADDERSYESAAAMLKALNVQSIRLMSNNPRKIAGLRQHGIVVSDRLPHVMRPNRHNRNYLETKARKSGHMITFDPARWQGVNRHLTSQEEIY